VHHFSLQLWFRFPFGVALVAITVCCVQACSESTGIDAPIERAEPIVPAGSVAEALSWRDLIPTEELQIMDDLNSGNADPSLMSRFIGSSPVEGQMGTFNTVTDLDGLHVRMPGYILPINFQQSGQAREFLLLPYHGACVHYPPPPPNQIVYLTSDKPISFNNLWEPIYAEGVMSINRVDTDLAASAYSMQAIEITPYRP
jgi:hypothetical protein